MDLFITFRHNKGVGDAIVPVDKITAKTIYNAKETIRKVENWKWVVITNIIKLDEED